MSRKIYQREVKITTDLSGKETRTFGDPVYDPWGDKFQEILEELIWEAEQENRPKSDTDSE